MHFPIGKRTEEGICSSHNPISNSRPSWFEKEIPLSEKKAIRHKEKVQSPAFNKLESSFIYSHTEKRTFVFSRLEGW